MTYMIIEHFQKEKIKTLYKRFEEKGRLLPPGVQYLDSWIDEKVEVCYQLMESESIEKLEEWIVHWQDVAKFKIVPVISSAQAKEIVFSKKEHIFDEPIFIRNATAKDAESISNLLLTAFAEFQKNYTPKAFQATTINPIEVISRMQEGAIWVAVLDKKVVGTVSTLKNNKELYIRGMAVHTQARGKKIALQLLQKVEIFAQENNCDHLRLATTPYLKKAIQLYEKFGFKIINAPPYQLFGTPLFVMKKELKNL